MRLIAGLGNPGKGYINTRHNIGFRVIDGLAERFNVKLKKKLFGRARQAHLKIFDKSVMLIQPVTYMNLSGRCIAHYLNIYNIPLDSILIVCDDISLPLGEIRLRPQGSSGGHNGLESIIKDLRTKVFPRLRMGVGKEQPIDNFKEFLLSDFEKDETARVEESIYRAGDACLYWLREGIDKAMNIYNR